jgi:hypothetical protein
MLPSESEKCYFSPRMGDACEAESLHNQNHCHHLLQCHSMSIRLCFLLVMRMNRCSTKTSFGEIREGGLVDTLEKFTFECYGPHGWQEKCYSLRR